MNCIYNTPDAANENFKEDLQVTKCLASPSRLKTTEVSKNSATGFNPLSVSFDKTIEPAYYGKRKQPINYRQNL